MLPLRVELKGVLTYKDRTVFDFSREWLWASTGKNGGGKSAIFDAITYALYGEHRGGKQHDERLISQGRDGARVVFDFCVGTDAYRVERTITRRATPRRVTYDKSCQAYRIVGGRDADAPDLLAIDGTADKDGLEKWVERWVMESTS